MRGATLLAPLLALAAAAGAAAAALGWPAPAAAFERSRVPTDAGDGPELFWCQRAIPFAVNQDGSKDAGKDASIEAARLSFVPWTEPGCSDLDFVYQGTTSRSDIGFDQTEGAVNLNLVVWREVLCSQVAPEGDPCFEDGNCNNVYDCFDQPPQTIAITTTTFNNATGEIYDADVELNGSGFVFTTADSPKCPNPPPRPANCVATDIRNTLTHEIGHVIGLDHVPAMPQATMFPQASLGDLNKRDLHSDDIAGLCLIYPKGKPTEGCAERGCGCLATRRGAAVAPWSLGLLLLAPLAVSGALRRRRARS